MPTSRLTLTLLLALATACAPPLPLGPASRSSDSDYARELDLDDPLLHLRLPGGAPGALRLEGDTSTSFDGRTQVDLELGEPLSSREITLELFLKRSSGCVLSLFHHDANSNLSLCIHDDVVFVSLGERAFDTGVLVAPAAWRHLALSWDGHTASLLLDGIPRWSHRPATWRLRADATITLGARRGCARGCHADHLSGLVDELAVHDRALPPHRLLSHWLVARGARPPSRPITRAGTITPQLGATDHLLSLVVAPGGDLALTSSGDRVVRLWDLQARAQGRAFGGHEHAVGALAISPDRRLVFSGDNSGHANLWWLDDDTLHHALPGHAFRISSATWSEDGLLVASGDTLGHVKIWDARHGTLVRSLPAPTRAYSYHPNMFGLPSLLDAQAYIVDLAFSPGASHLAVAYADGTVRHWPTRSGPASAPLTVGHPLSTFTSSDSWDMTLRDDLFLSPNAAFVASTDGLGNATVRALPSGEVVGALQGRQPDRPLAVLSDGRVVMHQSGDFDLAFSDPDSDDAKESLVLWDPHLETTRRLRTGECVDATLTQGSILALCEDGLSSFPDNPGPPLPTLDLPNAEVESVSILDRRLAFATPDATYLWDLDALSPIATLAGGVKSIHASHALSRFVVRRRHAVDLVDPRTGAVTHRFGIARVRSPLDTDTVDVSAFAVARDAPIAIVGRQNHEVELISLPSGARIHRFEDTDRMTVTAHVTDDGKFAAVGDRSAVVTFDLTRYTEDYYAVSSSDGVDALHISDDGRRVFLGAGDRHARHVLVARDQILWERPAHGMRTQNEIFTDVVALPSGDWITSADSRDIWRWSPEGEPSILKGHSSIVLDLSVSRDGDLLASASSDGTARVWNLAAPGTPSVAFFARDGHWAVFEDGGLFDTSADGAHLLAVSRGGRVEGVDRRAVELNRPDLLRAMIGAPNDSLSEHWRTRHEVRKTRQGYREANSATASLRLLDVREDATERAATFTVRARADGDTLRAIQAYVDGVPAYPDDGLPVTGDRARVSLELPLTSRDRIVELEAVTRRGIRSPRVTRALTASIEPEPRTLYLLSVGVSEYLDPDTADLEYAAQDARDVSAFFAANAGPFDEVEPLMLVDEQVTRSALEAAREFTRRARPQDAVIVFLAGHGLHSRDASADYYFLTHDADPKALATTAAPFELIESLLDARVGARDKLALIDTCQSGEDPSPGRGRTAGERSRGVESTPLSTARDRALSTYGRRLIYRDLRRRTGAIVFSSSLGHELSLESDAWANGAFTEALLEALTAGDPGPDGALSISELRDQVSRRVPELTRGRQHPTVDRDNLLRDFTISRPSP